MPSYSYAIIGRQTCEVKIDSNLSGTSVKVKVNLILCITLDKFAWVISTTTTLGILKNLLRGY
jgi:hypothetical protein